VASCKALRAYIQKVQDDADRELKEWEDDVKARELAEKRRVAPGWLDSDARILEPEKKDEPVAPQVNLMDTDVSSAETSGTTGEGEQLDRAFGGLNIK